MKVETAWLWLYKKEEADDVILDSTSSSLDFTLDKNLIKKPAFKKMLLLYTQFDLLL